ncbi:MAG: hypothetical protein ABSG93_20260 [Solirubrobacteraceae bacterium]
MTGRIPKRLGTLAVTLLVAVGLMALGAGAASAGVLYDNVPKALPGNFASIGFEATSTAEYGGEVELTKTSPKKALPLTVTAVMSSWTCQSGGWSTDNCATTPGATFNWPITLKLYSVGAGGEPVGPIAEKTETFAIPYRPSASPLCKGELAGTWLDTTGSGKKATHACYNGLAAPITFQPLTVAAPTPKKLIVSLAYNTETWGAHPTGEEGPENSLNVAISESWEGTLTKGADPVEGPFVNSNWSPMYCGSSATLNTFSFGGTCWGEGGGFQPVIEVKS